MDPSLAQGYFETSYQFSYQYNLDTKKRDWATKKNILCSKYVHRVCIRKRLRVNFGRKNRQSEYNTEALSITLNNRHAFVMA